MTLTDNIHRLTRTHLTGALAGHPVEAPSLLSELRAAVKPGNDGSSGSSGGKPSPINADAVDMLTQIQFDAQVDYTEMHGMRFRGTVEALLQSHVGADLTDEWEAYLERVTLEWIDAIDALLRPTKPRRKLRNLECPSCEQKTHGEGRAICLTANVWGPDEKVLSPAAWHVQCEGCGAEWAGEKLRWLLVAIENETKEKAA